MQVSALPATCWAPAAMLALAESCCHHQVMQAYSGEASAAAMAQGGCSSLGRPIGISRLQQVSALGSDDNGYVKLSFVGHEQASLSPKKLLVRPKGALRA